MVNVDLCSAIITKEGLALQCFNAVGWAAGRAFGLKKLIGGVLALLSVWS